MPAIHRVRQFFWAAGARVHLKRETEIALICYLPPAAVTLFRTMPSYDRRHSLDVAWALQQRGHTESDFLAAALLHDVGKTARQARRLRLWHRVAVVLIRALDPGLLERIGQDRPGAWRQPFYVQRHHAEIGAEMARRAGCSPRTVEMIGRHEAWGQIDDPVLQALQAADNEN